MILQPPGTQTNTIQSVGQTNTIQLAGQVNTIQLAGQVNVLQANVTVNINNKQFNFVPSAHELIVIIAPPGYYTRSVIDQLKNKYNLVNSPADALKPGLYMTTSADPVNVSCFVRYIYIEVSKEMALSMAVHGEKTKINEYFKNLKLPQPGQNSVLHR
jgi:hypothetical protein